MHQALAALKSLDVDAGVRQTGGRLDFYVSFLRRFAKSHAHSASNIALAMQAGDWDGAHLLAHTVKGVAATMAAAQLLQAAQTLDTALRAQAAAPAGADTSLAAAAFAEFQSTLQDLLCDLQSVPGLLEDAATGITQAQPIAGQTSLRVAHPELLAQLCALVAEHDSAAVDLWDSHGQLLQACLGRHSPLELALQAYDFERAHALLKELP